jgi:hypothetical protein
VEGQWERINFERRREGTYVRIKERGKLSKKLSL